LVERGERGKPKGEGRPPVTVHQQAQPTPTPRSAISFFGGEALLIFGKLIVYQRALSFAERISTLTAGFPPQVLVPG